MMDTAVTPLGQGAGIAAKTSFAEKAKMGIPSWIWYSQCTFRVGLEERKRGERTGLDTLVVHAVNVGH